MFLEHLRSFDTKKGCIEVICGSMFSGKTEELIRRLKRARIARQKVEIFKPKLDTRYDEIKVVSHDANFIHSTPVESSAEILKLANDVEVIGVDEAQFFDDEIVDGTCILAFFSYCSCFVGGQVLLILLTIAMASLALCLLLFTFRILGRLLRDLLHLLLLLLLLLILKFSN